MAPRRDEDREQRYPPGFAQALGRTIKVMRTEQGIERRELAERAGISYSYITEIENGNKPPSSAKLGPIASALGVRMSELIQAAEERVDSATREEERSLLFEDALFQPSASLAMEEPPPPRDEPSSQLRYALRRHSAMRPSLRGPNRNLRAALMELEDLLPSLSPDDVERLLDFARRLAR